MSRSDFAEAIGIHPQTLYMYEAGKRIIDVELLRTICVKFDVSVEWMVFGTKQEPETASAQMTASQEKLAEQERMINEQNEEIRTLKDELIEAQSQAIKAYGLAAQAHFQSIKDND